MTDIRWNVDAPIRTSKEAGILRRTIALVDASFRAASNNRDAKLGFGNCTFATAILGFDHVTKLQDSGDGTSSNLARWPFEPDNWALRLNRGFDNVWAVRLIVDKENKANEKKNRSTHWINQAHRQRYANSADLFWIVKRGASTEFGMNGAGYNQVGGGDRDALALSMALNEGFISDGQAVGQLAHILTFVDIDATPTDGGGGGGDVPTGSGVNQRGPTSSDVISGPQNNAGSITGSNEIPLTGAGAQGGGPGTSGSFTGSNEDTAPPTFKGADGSYYRRQPDGTFQKVPGT